VLLPLLVLLFLLVLVLLFLLLLVLLLLLLLMLLFLLLLVLILLVLLYLLFLLLLVLLLLRMVLVLHLLLRGVLRALCLLCPLAHLQRPLLLQVYLPWHHDWLEPQHLLPQQLHRLKTRHNSVALLRCALLSHWQLPSSSLQAGQCHQQQDLKHQQPAIPCLGPQSGAAAGAVLCLARYLTAVCAERAELEPQHAQHWPPPWAHQTQTTLSPALADALIAHHPPQETAAFSEVAPAPSDLPRCHQHLCIFAHPAAPPDHHQLPQVAA
jgi:hypothetical protein